MKKLLIILISAVGALYAPPSNTAFNQDPQFYHAFFETVFTNNVSHIESFITSSADIDTCDNTSQTALYIATTQNLTEAALCLINAGADVNLHPPDKWQPLFIATNNRNLILIHAFLKHGGNIATFNTTNSYPLQAAIKHGHTNIIRALIIFGNAQCSEKLKTYAQTKNIDVSKFESKRDYLHQSFQQYKLQPMANKVNFSIKDLSYLIAEYATPADPDRKGLYNFVEMLAQTRRPQKPPYKPLKALDIIYLQTSPLFPPTW